MPEIFPEWKFDSTTGIYMLSVMLEPYTAELCGLELDITYSSDVLLLSSCERGDALDSLNFDCSLSDKRIRLIFWGDHNSRNGGRLATVCFAADANAEKTSTCEFILSLPTRSSAIYFDGDCIYTTDINLMSINVRLENNLRDEHEPPPTEIATEAPAQQYTEAPTQIHTEEPSQNLPFAPIGEDQSENTFLKGLSKVMICISCAVNAPMIVPYFFHDIFRKGYF